MDYLKAEGRYNVVCSFGFIEHFRNWRDVIRLQASLVDNGGLIIITTPNFSGFFQFWYHKILDKENLDRHIQESMNPNKWKEIVIEEGFDVIDYGYIGFEFWDENPKKNFVERILKRVLIHVAKCINRLTPNHRTTASYCYLVARRK
ncbi:MAG: methyltransferase domain-containing protein [Pedobacter sp.]|nr:MAG: methyltransferase domain-containing protein [Pedobacter sp.]